MVRTSSPVLNPDEIDETQVERREYARDVAVRAGVGALLAVGGWLWLRSRGEVR